MQTLLMRVVIASGMALASVNTSLADIVVVSADRMVDVLTGRTVERPQVTETTALGAAYLAGICAAVFKNEEDIAARWALDRRFVPEMKKAERDRLYSGWRRAISRVR